ncbi:ATPase [Aureococcus anophagefferens]|nr:ATPase [Aureococcus anophagefferens]
MEFTEELIEKPICNLSGGWKMKLALARAVLLNADLLLLDEPTNHLDVQKQAWLCDFLTGPACEHVTTLVVSHDSKFLNKFVEKCPMAKAYFSIHDTEMKFTFPVPGPLEGVKSKTKAIIQAKNISFTRRAACIGPNGAGKSTLIKALVGETKPDAGSPEIYRHQNCRVAYVAQHAFHHIEQHLEMSPVEYIQWRFSGGLDKEQQAMEAAQMTDEEKAKLKQNFVVYLKELAAELDEAGNATGERQIIFEKMEPLKAGQKPRRRTSRTASSPTACARSSSSSAAARATATTVVLESNGFFKLMKAIDDKIAAEAGNVKPLTTGCIQKHLDDFGLMEEFGTYGKMKNLSGGQKVNRRTTSTATRSALAIKDFEGGVLMISHNAEFFGDIAPEIWEIPGDQKVHISGAEWMEAVRARELAEQKLKKKAAPTQEEDKFDALGNKIESVTKAADVDRDMIKLMTKKLKGLKERLKKGDGSVEDEIFELEDKLDAANAMMKKEKEAAKAEKEAQKKLNKKEKAPADKKKATKKKIFSFGLRGTAPLGFESPVRTLRAIFFFFWWERRLTQRAGERSDPVLCADGACLDADAVVIAIGARYMFPGEDDFSKPVGDRFKAYRAESAKLDANKSVLVVGGGPAGCELAAELKCFGEHDVTLVHSGTSLCSSQRRPSSARCAAALKDLGIAVILDDRVAINAKQRSTRGAVTLKDGTIKTKKGVEIKATEAFWCGGNEYMGREVFDMLESSKSGQLVVDGGLRAGQARVWAAGEIAHAAGASEAAAMGRRGEERGAQGAARGRGAGPDDDDGAAVDALLGPGRVARDFPGQADDGCVPMASTSLRNALMCHPQERNTAGRVFGGVLMRRALELAFATAFSYGGAAPLTKALDRATSFVFTVDGPRPLKRVLPSTRAEARLQLAAMARATET